MKLIKKFLGLCLLLCVVACNKYEHLESTLLLISASPALKVDSTSKMSIFEEALANSNIVRKNHKDARNYFPSIRKSGKISFSLQPIESMINGEKTRISFGVPFPRGFLTDIDKFQILDSNGNEVPLGAKIILPWRSDNSIRSVQVQIDAVFSKNAHDLLTANRYYLKWGIGRSLQPLPLVSIHETWTLIDDEAFESKLQIYEPKAYAIFSPSWYGDSIIKTRLIPLHSHPDFSAQDIAFKLFGNTAINLVDPRVKKDKLIKYKKNYAAWLFDRAMTIYQLAFRTGEFKYLRAAHRASQFYLQHINKDGYFTLKPSEDMKYSYGEGLVANMILTGDERVPGALRKMVPAWKKFRTFYTLRHNFWTERHAGYQLLGLLTAYEVLGDEGLKNNVKEVFTLLRKMQISPASGVPVTGGLMHTKEAHGEGGTEFVSSPWMSTILLGAIERYYINFEENEAIDFIIRMADYFNKGTNVLHEWKGYKGKESFILPYYLAIYNSSDKQRKSGGLSDLEHANDVSKIFALAYFFSCQTGCDNSYLSTIAKLNNTVTTFGFPHWIRSDAPKSGLSTFRLAPARKFSWWFQHTSNNDFLIGKSTRLPFFKKNVPEIEITQSTNFKGNFKPGDEITFNYSIKNIGKKSIQNLVIETKTLQTSPSDLLEIIAKDKRATKRNKSVVWKIANVSESTTIDGLQYTIKVKDFPILQTTKRPLGSIVSYVSVDYCSEEGGLDTCQFPENSYDLGQQTISTQSKWHYIEPLKPNTPPKISIQTLNENDVKNGLVEVLVEVIDPDEVSNVELYIDNEMVKRFDAPPYNYEMKTNELSENKHEFKVLAWDSHGSEGSLTVSFYAQTPDILKPVVNILTPQGSTTSCDDKLLKFKVSDENRIDKCEIAINGNKAETTSCGSYVIPKIKPLISASAFWDFQGEGRTVNSTNKGVLKGQGYNTLYLKGYKNRGLMFTNRDSYVEILEPNLKVKNDISVSFWIKPNSHESVIISQDWSYIGNESGWAISLGSNNHKNTNPLSITWSSGTGSKNLNEKNVVQSAPNTIKPYIWQHVVVRKKNTLVEIFINGKLSQAKSLKYGQIGWPFHSKKTLYLGKPMMHPENYNKYYKGLIDELAIWNSSISNQDVEDLYRGKPDTEKQVAIISAFDHAGNKGTASFEFQFAQCN